jgi:hypothetical protein
VVEFLIEKRSKNQLPRADVPSLVPGALALTARARDALGPFLSRFGQLLELDCQDGPAWYFNATNVIDCIDRESSVRREDGSIAREAFFADKIPSDPAVFKDPAKARSRIYVNRAAKEAIEKIVADSGLTGLNRRTRLGLDVWSRGSPPAGFARVLFDEYVSKVMSRDGRENRRTATRFNACHSESHLCTCSEPY